jgi:hypothetical protein
MNDNNRYALVNSQINQVVGDLIKMQMGEVPVATLTPGHDDAFDHEAWMLAELTALKSERAQLEKVMSIDGTVSY